MRFLVDENLSPRLCGFLAVEGSVAEHVRDVVGAGASDEAVLQRAADIDAVIVTADTDFGTLLARSGRARPSVILVRDLLTLSADAQGLLIAANLEQLRVPLGEGAVVVVTRGEIRVRPLPIL